MKYLFFDIECARQDERGRNQIYSFGYLLADEKMEIIKSEEDILINPDVKWHWYIAKNILAYPKAQVNEQPKFPEFYQRLKNLLEDSETVVCGYGVENDVAYLLDECERYNLPPFTFSYYDVGRLSARVFGGNAKGLQKAYVELFGVEPNDVHRSDQDALHTYEIAKEIAVKKEKTLMELFSERERYMGKTSNFQFGYGGEPMLTRDERHELKEQKRIERQEKQERKRAERQSKQVENFLLKHPKKNGEEYSKEEKEDLILRGSKNDFIFQRLLKHVGQKTEREQILAGKKISISANYETFHLKNMAKIVQIICDSGGQYIKQAGSADIFVDYDQNEPCKRRDWVKNAIESGENIQVLPWEEFLQILELTEDSLNALPDEELEYLLDKKYDF